MRVPVRVPAREGGLLPPLEGDDAMLVLLLLAAKDVDADGGVRVMADAAALAAARASSSSVGRATRRTIMVRPVSPAAILPPASQTHTYKVGN